jgi:hypothetical protein
MDMEFNAKSLGVDIFKTGEGVVLTDGQTPTSSGFPLGRKSAKNELDGY